MKLNDWKTDAMQYEDIDKSVLDVCCGPRGMWFDRSDSRALFLDKRRETHTIDYGKTAATKGRSPLVIDPDMIADFTDLPFPDDSFCLVVFDPPHLRRAEARGVMTKRFGILNGDWREMIADGFKECLRVLKPSGVLIFKWAETEIPLSEILALTPEKPLFGHKTSKHTRWVTFIKAACDCRHLNRGHDPECSYGPSAHDAAGESRE